MSKTLNSCFTNTNKSLVFRIPESENIDQLYEHIFRETRFSFLSWFKESFLWNST